MPKMLCRIDPHGTGAMGTSAQANTDVVARTSFDLAELMLA